MNRVKTGWGEISSHLCHVNRSRGRSVGVVIPALGSGRYSPGPHIVLPSWRKGSDPHCTINIFWGQPGALATVSKITSINPTSDTIPSTAYTKTQYNNQCKFGCVLGGFCTVLTTQWDQKKGCPLAPG